MQGGGCWCWMLISRNYRHGCNRVLQWTKEKKRWLDEILMSF